MVYAPQKLTIDNFLGIRQKTPFTGQNNTVSAEVAINVELSTAVTGQGNDIKTVNGNVLSGQLEGYSIIKMFESLQYKDQQDQTGTKHLIVYAENKTQGALFEYKTQGALFELLVDDLTKTGNANGITMVSSAYDVFVFTNGEEYYTVNFERVPMIEQIMPVHAGQPLKGLAICESKGQLVIGSKGLLKASRVGDVSDWNEKTTVEDKTKPWTYPFGKHITALVTYIQGVLVFTAEDSSFVTYKDSLLINGQSSSLGGCYSHESLIIHGEYLFFYDNIQKNIYYYVQNDIGQKRLGEPLAKEVQNFFTIDLKRVQLTSYIGNNKNQIWLLMNDDLILIYDYLKSEFTQRKGNLLNTIMNYNFTLMSGDLQGKIFYEDIDEARQCTFDGVYYPAQYMTQYMDFGSFTNLKELDIKPLITYAKSYNNNFVFRTHTNKKIKSKRIELNQGLDFTWGDGTPKTDRTPANQLWGVGIWANSKSKKVGTVKGKAPTTFYYMKFEFATEKVGDDFKILQTEFKDWTEETDTMGAK